MLLSASSSNDPNYTYNWSTDGVNFTDVGTTYSSTPGATTTYYTYAEDNSGGPNNGCGALATTVVTVNQTPPTPVISPASATICNAGDCVDLTVGNGTVSAPGLVTVGTGTVQNASTGIVNMPPYSDYYTGNRHQMLVLASELSAAGAVAGNIN